MNAYEEILILVRSGDASDRIAELDEVRAKELLAAALDLLRDAQQVEVMNPMDLGGPGFA